MGNVVLGEIHPPTIISTGLGVCLAMGMSGAFGRYFSERAERKHALRQIEKYMFTDLSGSILEQDVFSTEMINQTVPSRPITVSKNPCHLP